MKKILILALLLTLALGMQAQSHVRVWQGGESKRLTLAQVGDMTFSGSTITLGGQTYNLSTIDSIIVVPEVTVAYNGSSATVNIPASVAADVTATVNGAHVTLNNTNVSNEVEVVLNGSSTNGSLTYVGSYKCTIQLNGLDLTSQTGSPLDIQCGKRVALVLPSGTVNSLTDAASGTQDACLYCRGHLEIEGAGTLNITGNARHGIKTKEYLQLKKSTGTLNILKAASDGIHAGQYFLMGGGQVNIDRNTLGDGIQAEITNDPTEEMNGQMLIKGGTIQIEVAGEDCEGLKADSLITISGGTIHITASGNGSRGIKTSTDMIISDTDATTTITVAATGGVCTNPDHTADPHRCMGIKVDGKLTVTGGTTTVTNTGTKSRGIRVGSYTKTGGTVTGSLTYSN